MFFILKSHNFDHTYRVSHSKPGKVILLWWRYRLWFLLIFWILRVHEKGTFMLNSSVFIFLMLRALYRMICKNTKSIFGKNSLNVSNVKPFSKIYFQDFWPFYAFLVGMTACNIHIHYVLRALKTSRSCSRHQTYVF